MRKEDRSRDAERDREEGMDLLFSWRASLREAFISRHRRSRILTRCFHHSFDRSDSSRRDRKVWSAVGENGNGEERREGDVIVSSVSWYPLKLMK